MQEDEAADRDPDVQPKPDGVEDKVGDIPLRRRDGGCGGPVLAGCWKTPGAFSHDVTR